jgi:hypothetical protein
VYDEAIFEELGALEKPDFDLRRRGRDYVFGVEVTDFYLSESAARIANVQGYATALLSGGDHLHKEDVEALKVVDCKIVAPDGTVTGRSKGILQRHPTLGEFQSALLCVIAEKNRLAAVYRTGPGHVNLIVRDLGSQFFNQSAVSVSRTLFTPALKSSALWMRFREIFLVTTIEEQQQVVFPLRTLAFLGEFYLFNGALVAFREDRPVFTPELFASYMRQRGLDVLIIPGPNGPAALLGNTGLDVGPEGILVLDQQDYPATRVELPKAPEALGWLIGEGFDAFFEEFRAKNVFECGMCRPARPEPRCDPAVQEPEVRTYLTVEVDSGPTSPVVGKQNSAA